MDRIEWMLRFDHALPRSREFVATTASLARQALELEQQRALLDAEMRLVGTQLDDQCRAAPALRCHLEQEVAAAPQLELSALIVPSVALPPPVSGKKKKKKSKASAALASDALAADPSTTAGACATDGFARQEPALDELQVVDELSEIGRSLAHRMCRAGTLQPQPPASDRPSTEPDNAAVVIATRNARCSECAAQLDTGSVLEHANAVMAEFIAARRQASAEERSLLECELEATRHSSEAGIRLQPLSMGGGCAGVSAPGGVATLESRTDSDREVVDLQLKLDKAKDLLKKMSLQSDEKVGALRGRILELEAALAAATRQCNELQSQLADAPRQPPPPPPYLPALQPPPPPTPPPPASAGEAVARLEQEKRTLTAKVRGMLCAACLRRTPNARTVMAAAENEGHRGQHEGAAGEGTGRDRSRACAALRRAGRAAARAGRGARGPARRGAAARVEM
jgi:hypothetical protein